MVSILDDDDEPESDLVPTVEIPDTADADPELARAFWLLVLVFNAALLGVSLGLMLVVFRDQWLLGGGIFLGGLVAFLLGVLGYRRQRKS